MTLPVHSSVAAARPDCEDPPLTRAEARAQLRSAPLTHFQLKAYLEGLAKAEPRRPS